MLLTVLATLVEDVLSRGTSWPSGSLRNLQAREVAGSIADWAEFAVTKELKLLLWRCAWPTGVGFSLDPGVGTW